MADNVQITPGSGVTMRTDDVAGVQIQVMKIALGADGAEDLLIDSGQKTMANSMPVVLASDHSSLPISYSNNRVTISPTIAVDAAAYAANDCLGDTGSNNAIQTLTGALRVSGGTGIWESLIIRDTSNVKPAVQVLIFDASPVGTYTDNGVSTGITSDVAKVIRSILIPSSAYSTFGGVAFCDVNILQPVKAASGTTLYAVWMVTGTPTFAATNAISATYSFIQD